jgi:glucoamylase
MAVAAHAALDHRWPDASKQSVGTAYGRDSSKVWFTVGHGIVNEVYYPRVDTAQVADSQLLFSGARGAPFLEEKRDFAREVSHPPGVPRARVRGAWGEGESRIEFTKDVVTDPDRPVLRVRYRFAHLPSGVKVYVLHKPAADNDGAFDVGRVVEREGRSRALVAWDDESRHVAQAVVTSGRVARASVGIVGETDGWQDLARHGRMLNEIRENGPGNIALTAEVEPGSPELEVAVGFGPNPEEATEKASESLATSFDDALARFDRGWNDYLARLARAPWLRAVPERLREDLLWNAALIKAHEDKSNPGAIVASLSIPDLPGGKGAGDSKNTGGYHLVWPRDLFKAALALLRLGDKATALNALRFMARMESNGRISQNTWVDGRAFWTGEQMDQEAFPILLARELTNAGVGIPEELREFLDRRVARLRASTGFTGQERWEEARGYSPNTLAVMAAALRAIDDREGAIRLLETTLRATVSYRGPLSTRPYFVRISETGDPDAGRYLHIANGGPSIQEYRVLDGGFLEWIRWFPHPEEYFGTAGTRLRDTLRETLPLYDDPANGVAELNGGVPLYHRYTSDAYGVDHRGGPWPILSLERALPELARSPGIGFEMIDQVRRLWGPGDMCPEQLLDGRPMPFGASPLVWCHAEMVELAYRSANRTGFYIPRH